MSARRSFTANRVLLAILWLGMAGFVVLHSFILFGSSGGQTVTSFRTAWFAGLGLVAAMVVYFGVLNDATASEE